MIVLNMYHSPSYFDPISVKFQDIPSVLINDVFQLRIFGEISICPLLCCVGNNPLPDQDRGLFTSILEYMRIHIYAVGNQTQLRFTTFGLLNILEMHPLCIDYTCYKFFFLHRKKPLCNNRLVIPFLT